MLKKYSFIFIGVFTLLLLVSTISYVNYQNASAQNYTGSNLNSTIPKVNGGIKIISPEKESFVPINSNSSFIIKGISKDNATADCKVSIIINGIKPYQPVQPMNGKEDYSTWQYNLSKNYTNFVLGSNKITAKSYCLPTQQSSYYSANVTGMNFSPEQLQSYNSTNMTATNSTTSNLTSSLVAGPHPVALEIQALKNSSSQMAIPTFVPATTTSDASSQAIPSIVPAVVDTSSPVVKDPVKNVKHDVKPVEHKTIKHVVKKDTTPEKKKDTTPEKKKDTTPEKKKVKDSNNSNNQDNKKKSTSNNLADRIVNNVKHNLAKNGIRI
jgi:hypothetical protein